MKVSTIVVLLLAAVATAGAEENGKGRPQVGLVLGGGGALGHPKVFLEMGQGTVVECPYCDRRFVLVDASELASPD